LIQRQCIEEYIVGFIAVQETTAATLKATILRELSLGLDIKDCRGQGYDSGANMVGVNSGVKTKILVISPTAYLQRVAVTTGIYILYLYYIPWIHKLDDNRMWNKS
jgi:hypothetical protein